MKHILFIICSNGFGHFRRGIRLAHTLLKNEDSIRITFCAVYEPIPKFKDNWELLRKLLLNPHFSYLAIEPNFELKELSQYIGDNHGKWIKQLPTQLLDSVDVVISDNLVPVLNYRYDTILMGSFLWAEIIPQLDSSIDEEKRQQFSEIEIQLLKKYSPPMICLKDMLMPYVRQYTIPVATGWMIEEDLVPIKKKSQRNGILVSGGGTGLLDDLLVTVIKILLEKRSEKIFISSSIAKKFEELPQNVYEFSYEEKAFRNLELMICRPGIGALTDAVTFGLPIVAVGSKSNMEMVFNAEQIPKLGFGINIVGGLANEIVEKTLSFWDNNLLTACREKLFEANRNGLEQAALFIRKRLSQ